MLSRGLNCQTDVSACSAAIVSACKQRFAKWSLLGQAVSNHSRCNPAIDPIITTILIGSASPDCSTADPAVTIRWLQINTSAVSVGSCKHYLKSQQPSLATTHVNNLNIMKVEVSPHLQHSSVSEPIVFHVEELLLLSSNFNYLRI